MTDPRHIDVRTWLVVRELDGGESLVAPAADPSLASFGDEADALDEQRVFLAEYFARVPPERVAGFDLPEGVSLQRVTVSLTREDLPRALAAPIDVAVPLLRIPAQGHGWAMVLPLGHTIYLERDELASPRFEEVVRAEVRRLVSARQPTPLEWLRLLPGAAERLEPIEVAFEAAALADGRTAALRRAIVEREQRKRWGEVLAAVADVIHASAERPLIARDTELGTLTALLTGTARVPVALVGEAGVGKSALVRAFVASRERSRPALVYATSGAQLVSGMSGFGQWQERLRRTLEAAAGLDAILWFDDLAELVADRPPPGGEGGIDLAGAMKPWLDEGKVRVIGELREERAADLAQRHVGFSSTFTRVRVPALPPIDAERALAAVAAHVAKRGGTGLAPAATSALVALADRYLPYEAFPGKAIALYDELRAARAASPGAPTMGAQHADIDADEVFAAFARRSGVPAFLLREAQAVRLDELIDALGRRVVGQREAVRRVAETVCVVKASMQPRGKPLATFLFVGPTGVGKTELARALAEVLFGASGEDRLLRFDMSEYMDALAGERLIRGSERPGEPSSGVLVRKVREQPFSVVLLDEIEKAHPSVFDLLLQVCGEGRLTDVRGRTAYFHNAIIILTSNLGAAAKRPLAGFGGRTTSDADHYLAHVEATFRPELVNRLDRVIPFSALEREEIRAIARKVVRGVSTRRGLAEPGVALDVSEGALDVLADGGFHAAYGARALRRHLDRALVDPVAHALAARAAEIRAARVSVRATSEPPAQTAEGRTIALVSPGLVIAIELAGAQQRRELRGIDAVPGVRRELSRLAHDERVERVREQVAFLVAQLGKRPSRRGRDDAPQARAPRRAERRAPPALPGARRGRRDAPRGARARGAGHAGVLRGRGARVVGGRGGRAAGARARGGAARGARDDARARRDHAAPAGARRPRRLRAVARAAAARSAPPWLGGGAARARREDRAGRGLAGGAGLRAADRRDCLPRAARRPFALVPQRAPARARPRRRVAARARRGARAERARAGRRRARRSVRAPDRASLGADRRGVDRPRAAPAAADGLPGAPARGAPPHAEPPRARGASPRARGAVDRSARLLDAARGDRVPRADRRWGRRGALRARRRGVGRRRR
jgi:ATP-dependent Clp protease ATP-binding subunit ClpC